MRYLAFFLQTLAVAAIFTGNWYVRAAPEGAALIFYDQNSTIVLKLSNERGGIDDLDFDRGVLAVGWWRIEGRKKCELSLIGRDMREFERVDLGDCDGEVRVSVEGSMVAVSYSAYPLDFRGCVVRMFDWEERKLLFQKRLFECDRCDVEIHHGKLYFAFERNGHVVLSDNYRELELKCEKFRFKDDLFICDSTVISISSF